MVSAEIDCDVRFFPQSSELPFDTFGADLAVLV